MENTVRDFWKLVSEKGVWSGGDALRLEGGRGRNV